MLAVKSINYDTDKKKQQQQKNKASLHMDHHAWNFRHTIIAQVNQQRG